LKKQTLVLSDVHLSQAHPDDPADPLWMRYRRREHHPDREFAALVDHVLARYGADPIEVVFNGDVFDFDAPVVKDGTSSFEELPPTDEGCTTHVRLILADHQEFFGAAAKILSQGHEVTFLSGNHDIELYWPGVRRAIEDELVRLALRFFDGGLGTEGKRSYGEDIARRIRFRAWFHISNDRIYFEHGSQYDIHNGVRHAAVPLTKDGTRIHPVLGKLAFRRTGARMGYFNPYYEETFYMGLFGYLGHYVRFYATSHRHIVRTFAKGALSTVAEITRYRHRDDRVVEGRAALRAELGSEIADEAIDATHALRARPAEETMVPVLRELWVDRVGLVILGLAIAALVALFFGAKAAGIATAIEVLGFVIYELLTPKPDIRTYDSAPPSVLRIFGIHSVRAICMGHTHRPFVRFGEDGVYANSGSWCPAFHDALCTKPVLERRPVLWITTEEDDLYGGLHWWRDGAFEPDPEASRPSTVVPSTKSSERGAVQREAEELSPGARQTATSS
jgi:UDP-2,3-diacylglucosamine pyrophosphatase LpxH